MTRGNGQRSTPQVEAGPGPGLDGQTIAGTDQPTCAGHLPRVGDESGLAGHPLGGTGGPGLAPDAGLVGTGRCTGESQGGQFAGGGGHPGHALLDLPELLRPTLGVRDGDRTVRAFGRQGQVLVGRPYREEGSLAGRQAHTLADHPPGGQGTADYRDEAACLRSEGTDPRRVPAGTVAWSRPATELETPARLRSQGVQGHR